MTSAPTLILRAGCKINFFLRVTGKRPDGYHTIESLFLPLSAPYDELHIMEESGSGLTLTCSLPELDPQQNTIFKAYALYADATGFAPGLAVHLKKGIPHGAGLGGGSADAAVLLRYLNERAAAKNAKPLTMEQMTALAARVGADVPFFLRSVPALAKGIGDKLTPVPHPVPGWSLVLVCPPVRVSTAWAFSAWDNREKQGFFLRSLTISGENDRKPIVHGHWLENSFEAVVFRIHPELEELKKQLLVLGADAALMSGTGASVFGLFKQRERARAAAGKLSGAGEVFYQVL